MADLAIPSERVGLWDPGVAQGIEGGIPAPAATLYVADYGALDEGTGGSQSTNDAVFGTALAAANPAVMTRLVWPLGVYNVSSVAHGSSNLEVAGSGSGPKGAYADTNGTNATIFRPSAINGALLGSGVVWANNYNPNAVILSGLTKGSTSITVDTPFIPFNGDPATVYTGRLIRIAIPDDPAIPVLHTNGQTENRSVIVYTAGWNAGTKVLTFWPPLPFTPGVTTGAYFQQSQYGTQSRAGFKSFVIDGARNIYGEMQNGVSLQSGHQLWCQDVRVKNFNNYGFKVEEVAGFELKKCRTETGFGGGSNRAGLLVNRTSGAFVHHNILKNVSPNCEINFGTAGMVFAFNKGDGAWNINHGPFCSYNLYEGNRGAYFIADGYFGGVFRDFLFRNYDENGVLASLKRFTREYTIIGNINGTPGVTYSGDQLTKWGLPNIGNESSNGTAEFSTGDYWLDYNPSIQSGYIWEGTVLVRTDSNTGTVQLGTGMGAQLKAHLLAQGALSDGRCSGNLSTVIGFSAVDDVTDIATISTTSGGNVPDAGGYVYLRPGATGWQEKDLDVAGTVYRKANYYALYSGYPSGEDIGSDTIPDSMFLSYSPLEFGTMDFPAFNAADPVTTTTGNRLPVDQFEATGAWPDDVPPTPAAPVITLQPVTQTVTEGDDVTLSVNATGYPAPTYQWKKGGVDISGKTTRFLALLDVTTGDAGSYTCVATNTEGTDTSAAAVLTVNAASVSSTPQPRRRSASFGFGFTL